MLSCASSAGSEKSCRWNRAAPLAASRPRCDRALNGKNLVWFPEGGLSRSGELEKFKPGIGLLLERHETAVVPVRIEGTREALPPGHAFPASARSRFTSANRAAEELRRAGHGEKAHQRIANGLQQRAAELRAGVGTNKI
jgi:long-chain acyl-CoA synthetase